MNKFNQPNFMIIGAMKAATTSLYTYLIQHPDIFMSSIKEPKFFNNLPKNPISSPQGKRFNKITTFDQYYSLFSKVNGESAIGEASPSYLFDEKCPSLIYKSLPNIKLIIILRQPVDRAYSNFLHSRRSGKENISSFELAFKELNGPKKHFYKEKGFYTEQLTRYFELFPFENIKILLFEDFIKNPVDASKEVFQFLNVDADFVPEIKRQNQSGLPKGIIGWLLMKVRYYNLMPNITFSAFLPQFLINYIFKTVYKKPPQLDVNLKKQITKKYYKQEIKKLEELISMDLSHWID